MTTSGLSGDRTYICLVTASAEATFVADGFWIFGISLDAAGMSAASNRRIEMFNNPDVNDDSYEEVSSTLAFAGLSGDQTFTFSARESSAGDGLYGVWGRTHRHGWSWKRAAASAIVRPIVLGFRIRRPGIDAEG